jgi:hypothetical protein
MLYHHAKLMPASTVEEKRNCQLRKSNADGCCQQKIDVKKTIILSLPCPIKMVSWKERLCEDMYEYVQTLYGPL